MGTEHTGIPMILRNIQPAPTPVCRIIINKMIVNSLGYVVDSNQTFHVSMSFAGGGYASDVPITKSQPLLFQKSLQYGVYTVTESTASGFTLGSITPSTFTISAENPQQIVTITNIINLGIVTVSKVIGSIIRSIKYGALFNFPAASKNGGTGVGSIAPIGWRVPSLAEEQIMTSALGGDSIAGNKLKESGILFWNANTGTNISGFNARGAGIRSSVDGLFSGLKSLTEFYCNNISGQLYIIRDGIADVQYNNSYKVGASLRLLKNTSDYTPGETVTDIDGNVYPTVKIGTQVWMAANLAVTRFNDGTPIPNVTDNAAWSALTTPGYCWYNNDISNGYTEIDTLVPVDATYFDILITGQGANAIEQGGQVRLGEPLVFYDLPYDNYIVTEIPVAGYTLTSILPALVTIGSGSLTGSVVVVNGVNRTPTDILLSASTIPENSAINTIVGALSTTDPDTANTFSYTLVAGTGSADNASFNILGSNLRSSEIFDYETKTSYSIRVRSTDQGGLYFEKALSLSITDIMDSFIFPLSSTGTGAGVSTIQLTVNSDTVITIDGNAYFYDDSAGTINANQSRVLTAGGTRTFYLKVLSGNANLKVYNGLTKATQLDSWVSSTNAAIINAFNLSSLPSVMTYFYCSGSNTITGSLSSLPSVMTNFYCLGSNTITGSLSSLPSVMTQFYCQGNNTISEYTPGKNFANLMNAFFHTPVVGGGLSASNIDALIIDLDTGNTWGGGSKMLVLQGTNAPRTAASNAAVSSLVVKGVTVITN